MSTPHAPESREGGLHAVPDPAREYDAARRRAGVIALTWRGLLSVRGRDAVGFLNGMLTQDVRGMAPGEVRPACQVDRKGHLLADLRLYRLDDGALLDAPAERVVLLADLYAKHRIMEQVRIEPMIDMRAVLLMGPESPAVLERMGVPGWPASEIVAPGFCHWNSEVQGAVSRAVAAGAERIGESVLERLRIEAGRPRFGRDMDETHFPQEMRLEDAINVSKGCYLGQETLARLHFRGHVNRSLYGVRIPGEAPAVGAEMRIDGEAAGILSSVAGPPGTGDSLGLVLLRIGRQDDGRRVEVEGREAFLEALPFREGRVG